MATPHIDPDLAWYTGLSREKSVRPRCPFASVHRCPRFYQSLSLLGGAGSTKIEPKEDQRLWKKWKKSDLWPTTDEQATSVTGSPGKPSIYSNFCPEVAFERFGLFVVTLTRYADEIDVDAAHAYLGKQGVAGTDWRWAWSHAAPMHYTECPLYSPLDLDASRSGTRQEGQEAPADVNQAVFRALWNWSPFGRGVALTVLMLLVIGFTIWASLPERTKERLLDAMSRQTVVEPKPRGQ
jgi:hypothetical protein